MDGALQLPPGVQVFESELGEMKKVPQATPSPASMTKAPEILSSKRAGQKHATSTKAMERRLYAASLAEKDPNQKIRTLMNAVKKKYKKGLDFYIASELLELAKEKRKKKKAQPDLTVVNGDSVPTLSTEGAKILDALKRTEYVLNANDAVRVSAVLKDGMWRWMFTRNVTTTVTESA